MPSPHEPPPQAAIVDEAGDFLISIGAYADGLELYRAAGARLPTVSAVHQGLSCWAGHEGSHEATAMDPSDGLAPENLRA